MKFKATIAALAAAAMLAVPAVTMAAEPNGTYVLKDNTDYSQENLVGRYSAQIIQNGQFVSGSQTSTPGSRAATVQGLLGHLDSPVLGK